MKTNFVKIILIFIIIFLFTFSRAYALDLFLSSSSNDNHENSQEQQGTLSNEEKSVLDENNTKLSEDEITTYGSSSLDNESSHEVTSTKTTSSPTITTNVQHDNTLSISDIINIILISVCVVLILLGIAILIRCK